MACSTVAAAALPNVVEMGPEPTTDKETIAQLQRKVELLTEAVVSLLAMKSEAEHKLVAYAETQVPQVTRDDGRTFTMTPLPHHPTFSLQSYQERCGKRGPSKEEWMAAFEGLQIAAAKTDTLITTLMIKD